MRVLFAYGTRSTRVEQASEVEMARQATKVAPEADPVVEAQSATKRTKVMQTDVPAYSLDDALRVAQAISENYAFKPTAPLEVAAALNLTPSSSLFRMLTGASIAYGLTDGG